MLNQRSESLILNIGLALILNSYFLDSELLIVEEFLVVLSILIISQGKIIVKLSMKCKEIVGLIEN